MKPLGPLLAAILIAVGGCRPGDGAGGPAGLAIGRSPLPTRRTAGRDRGRYTILLYVMRGADHAARLERYMARTERDTGWRGLFVVSRAGYSELCWGRYAKSKQAAGNLAKAKRYRTPVGVPIYAKAIILPLPDRKQPGPPQWNLHNANGTYTVVVAEFYNVPGRYQGRENNAVAYCRQLRQQGQQAYYLHGPSVSLVTIGAFPESSIATVMRNNMATPEIRDPRILEIRRRHPYLAVNGLTQLTSRVNPSTGRVEKVPDPTYVNRIEKDESTLP